MSEAVHHTSETFRQELRTLFEKHQSVIYKAAYGVTGNPQDAEDVVQIVFMKLIESQFSTDFVHNPQGYLYRSAINEALKIVKSPGRRKQAGVDVYSLDVVDPEVDPDRQLKFLTIEAATAKLKPELAEIVRLHYKEGYSCLEIATMRRRPLGSVLKELSRARAELRRLLQVQEENGETQEGKHPKGRRAVLADPSEV